MNQKKATISIISAKPIFTERLNQFTLSAEMWLMILVAFLMPLHQPLASFTSIVLFSIWLLGALFRFITKTQHRNLNIKVLLLSSIYLYFIIGSFYSTQFNETIFDLQVKLSLLAFPLIFSLSAISIKGFGLIKRAFLLGVIVAGIIMLIRAYSRYSLLNDAGVFYYSRLANPFHPTYLSMYVGFAMIVLASEFLNAPKAISALMRSLYLAAWLFFYLLVVLLSSKAGNFSFIIISAGVLIGAYLRYKSIKIVGIGLILLLVLSATSVMLFPRSFGRVAAISNSLEKIDQTAGTSKESNFQRITIWKASKGIIQQNLFSGVGTGDVNMVLDKEYRKLGNFAGHEQGLNAHNQYIQTTIALGVPGLLMLLATIAIPFVMAIRKRAVLFATFLALVSFNLLFESMLERQAGVMFLAFFNSMLFAEMSMKPDLSHQLQEKP